MLDMYNDCSGSAVSTQINSYSTLNCFCTNLVFLPLLKIPERQTKKQATQYDCLPVPSLMGNGDKGTEIVSTVRKQIFCTGPTRAAKAEQKSLVPARQAQQTNEGRSLFICTLWAPTHLSFNKSAGVSPLYSLSGKYLTSDYKLTSKYEEWCIKTK
jgi:hypothetical protein